MLSMIVRGKPVDQSDFVMVIYMSDKITYMKYVTMTINLIAKDALGQLDLRP